MAKDSPVAEPKLWFGDTNSLDPVGEAEMRELHENESDADPDVLRRSKL